MRRAGARHHLGRHAPPVGAFAADQGVLDADDGEAGFGQPAGDLLATDAETDDDHVRLPRFSHARQLPTRGG